MPEIDVERLKQILSSMDVPSYRIEDFGWVAKNLAVRNSKHPRFKEVMEILKKLLADKMRKKDFKKIFGEIES